MLILEGFNDSCSKNEDVSEATYDEELVFVPFMNQIIKKMNLSIENYEVN